MANIIRIKRRAAGGAAGAPASLQNAELAFNEQDNTLYYGTGTGGAGGSATSVIAIGGSGAFQPLDSDLTAFANLATNGIVARTATGSVATRTLTQPAAGITVTNGDGVSGNPTLALANDLSALEGLSSTGLAVRTGSDTWAQRSITGTSGRITLTNGDGVAGNPTVDLTSLTIGGSGVGTFTKVTVDTYGRVTSTATASLSDLSAPTADLSIGGFKLTNLADPVGDQDAATKAYVDAARSGLDVKASVRAATTANISLTGTQTIDGVVLIAGDRVLVKDQSTASTNGIYVVAAGAWSRSTDADSSAEVTAGMFTFVAEGTTNADSGWVLSTNDTIVLNTTALTFVQFSGAGQVTAGAGLTKTGNTLDVIGTSNRITVNADSIDIASTYVGQSSITTLGTIGTGTWQGSVIGGTYGGTGVNNGASTITVGGNLSTAAALSFTGAFTGSIALTAATSVTLPTSGTILSDASTIDGGTF
jgi:hypothetical protein